MSAYAYAAIARPPRTLTELEQATLLKVTGEHRAGFRDHVLYAMALGTGLRAHELVALDVGDVFDAAGEPKRRVLLRVFKGQDEAGRERQEVVLSAALRTKLAALRAWKDEIGESLATEAPLFVSQRGLRLSTRQLCHAFGIWQVRAGFERHPAVRPSSQRRHHDALHPPERRGPRARRRAASLLSRIAGEDTTTSRSIIWRGSWDARATTTRRARRSMPPLPARAQTRAPPEPGARRGVSLHGVNPPALRPARRRARTRPRDRGTPPRAACTGRPWPARS